MNIKFQNLVYYTKFGIFFASNGKEYPFPLVGVFPKPPGPTKICGAEHHAGAWWLARPEGRFSAGGIAKAGGASRVNKCASRTPDTAPSFSFWADKAANPQSGFTGPAPDCFLSPAGTPAPA